MSTSGEQLPSANAQGTDVTIHHPAGVKYGGFWLRLLAFIIDAIILKIVMAVIVMVFFGGFVADQAVIMNNMNMAHPSPQEIHSLIAFGSPMMLIGIAIWWLYFTFLESSKLQGTLGKAIFGLKVIDREGKRISWGRANGRYWSKIISAIILYIGFFMIGWTKRKQGLHDKIADTFVMKSRSQNT